MKINIRESSATLSLVEREDGPHVVVMLDPPMDDWRPPEPNIEYDGEGNPTELPPIIHTISQIDVAADGSATEIARRIETELVGYDAPDINLADAVETVLAERKPS